MKKISFLIIILGIISIVANAQSQYSKNITIESVKDHIDTLASVTMKGRDTGSEGQKMAAQYISDIFSESGLKFFGNNFLNQFRLYSYENGFSTIGDNPETKWDCYYAGSRDVIDSTSLEPVFAGYGNSNDLMGLNTNGKIITLVADNARTAIDRINQIAKYDVPNYFLVALPIEKSKFKEENMVNFDTFFSLWIYGYFSIGQMNDSLSFAEDKTKYNLFNDLRIVSDKDVRVFFIHQNNLGNYFNKTSKDLIDLSKGNLKNNKNLLDEIQGKTVAINIDFAPKIKITQTENVLGYIEGTDLKNEFVVVGAHYDHVGVNYNGSINYGADDNASGTGAVLELAKQFAQAKKDGIQFKRSILFITYTAEEKGLYGSSAFVNNPPFQLKNIQLLVNMDMIGRNQDNKEEFKNTVYVAGWEGGNKFKRITKKENKNFTNLSVDFSPGLKQRYIWKYSSDHYPFAEKNVPVLVFFTGLHPDYHTPRDTPDKINYDKYYRIVQLVFETTWKVANK